MKKWYRKTELTQFEQFDGSEEMQGKYKALPDGSDTFIFWTTEGDMQFKKGDWIATGANNEHWAVADDVFKKTYKKVDKKGCKYCRSMQCLIGSYSSETGLNAWLTRFHKLMMVGKLKCKKCGQEEYVKRDILISYCPMCGRSLKK